MIIHVVPPDHPLPSRNITWILIIGSKWLNKHIVPGYVNRRAKMRKKIRWIRGPSVRQKVATSPRNCFWKVGEVVCQAPGLPFSLGQR